MDIKLSMQVLVGMCLLVLAILFLKSKMQMVFDFLLRMGMGMVLIWCLNRFFDMRGVELFVGCNMITLLTSGSLGFSGVALLFAISALKLL